MLVYVLGHEPDARRRRGARRAPVVRGCRSSRVTGSATTLAIPNVLATDVVRVRRGRGLPARRDRRARSRRASARRRRRSPARRAAATRRGLRAARRRLRAAQRRHRRCGLRPRRRPARPRAEPAAPRAAARAGAMASRSICASACRSSPPRSAPGSACAPSRGELVDRLPVRGVGCTGRRRVCGHARARRGRRPSARSRSRQRARSPWVTPRPGEAWRGGP